MSGRLGRVRVRHRVPGRDLGKHRGRVGPDGPTSTDVRGLVRPMFFQRLGHGDPFTYRLGPDSHPSLSVPSGEMGRVPVGRSRETRRVPWFRWNPRFSTVFCRSLRCLVPDEVS